MTRSERRTKTSSAVKQRYNQKVYDVVSVRIPKDISAKFKEKCISNCVSQANIIRMAIEQFLAK